MNSSWFLGRSAIWSNLWTESPASREVSRLIVGDADDNIDGAVVAVKVQELF